MPGPNPYRPPRPRPINPTDSALTTGLAVNPNGTYVANSYPTTAAIGGTGQYGANLPQVQVGGGGRLPNQGGSVGSKNVNAFLRNIIPNIYNTLQSFDPTPMPTTPYITSLPQTQVAPSYRPSPTVAPGSYAESQGGRYNISNVTDYADAAARGGPVSPLMQDRIIAGIAEDPAAFQNLTPAQRDAIERTLTGGAGGPGGGGGTGALGEGDFYGYERDPETGRNVRVVKNASNANFLNEKRWDPQARKFVSIGKLVKQGKLDMRTGKWNKRGNKQHQRRQGGGRKNPVQAGPTETTGGFTGSFGVVNFNTGTG